MASVVLFAQIPIRKDINQGKAALLETMKKNGFTLFKETKEEKHSRYVILFKEEVEVIIYFNQFENITDVIIFPGSQEKKDKILRIFNFDKWVYLYDKKDLLGNGQVYKVESFYARIPNNERSPGYFDIHFYRGGS